MSHEIRFFVKATKADAPRGLDYFIRDDGTVWRNDTLNDSSVGLTRGKACSRGCLLPCATPTP